MLENEVFVHDISLLLISLITQQDVKTYAVISLNDTAGIIEWVEGTHGLRIILDALYKKKGVSINVKKIRFNDEKMT